MLNLFNLSLQISGFPIKKAKAHLHEIKSIPDADFEKFVTNKKKEIVEYHLKNNQNYLNIVGESSFTNWLELPIMTKKDFQKPLQDRLSKGFNVNNIYVNKTSGSSGSPFIFAKDKYCHAMTWVNIFEKFSWFNINFNFSKQARFYGIPLSFIANKKERIKDFLSNRYRFSVFDLSEKMLEKILLKFSRKKFDYINGYTSSIVLFAKYLASKNIVLKDICPTIKCCIVTSEMLFDDDKILLQNQFGVPIINEYGASELDLIAFQNIYGDWQINTETLFVEILDHDNNVVPHGIEGRIVITSLFNKAHPFIRYDIGDTGIIDPKSSAKNVFLQKLIGRTNDIALLPSGKKSPGLTFYYITKSIIENDGNVKEFIVKQTKLDTFEVEYVSLVALTESQINEIQKAIILYLEVGLIFIFIRKDKLERSKNGKLKQFISFIK